MEHRDDGGGVPTVAMVTVGGKKAKEWRAANVLGMTVGQILLHLKHDELFAAYFRGVEALIDCEVYVATLTGGEEGEMELTKGLVCNVDNLKVVHEKSSDAAHVYIRIALPPVAAVSGDGGGAGGGAGGGGGDRRRSRGSRRLPLPRRSARRPRGARRSGPALLPSGHRR